MNLKIRICIFILSSSLAVQAENNIESNAEISKHINFRESRQNRIFIKYKRTTTTTTAPPITTSTPTTPATTGPAPTTVISPTTTVQASPISATSPTEIGPTAFFFDSRAAARVPRRKKNYKCTYHRIQNYKRQQNLKRMLFNERRVNKGLSMYLKSIERIVQLAKKEQLF